MAAILKRNSGYGSAEALTRTKTLGTVRGNRVYRGESMVATLEGKYLRSSSGSTAATIEITAKSDYSDVSSSRSVHVRVGSSSKGYVEGKTAYVYRGGELYPKDIGWVDSSIPLERIAGGAALIARLLD